MEINKVGVLGCGLMGSGIAQTCATAGMEVVVREVSDELARRFRALGFRYVTLDLHGYRAGAMNEILKSRQS